MAEQPTSEANGSLGEATGSAEAPVNSNRRTLVTGGIVFVVSLPVMYVLSWPALMTAGLLFWIVPALLTLKIGPLIIPPVPLGAALPKVDGLAVLFAFLASLQNGLLAAALSRGTARRRAVIAVTVLVLVPATIILGFLAFRAWVPPKDRSADVRSLIENAYEGDVTILSVRQVNDIGTETDVPFPLQYHEWGYRAEYRLEGVPVTVRLALKQDDAARKAATVDVDAENRPYFRYGLFTVGAVFPHQAAVDEAAYKAILNAYAEGSGQTEFAQLQLAMAAEGGTAPPGWTVYVVLRRLLEPGHWTWRAYEDDQYAVALDPATNEAKYLGKVTDSR